jgi:cell wall-associated NlpC family hydrolase
VRIKHAGAHTVCVGVQNVGAGLSPLLGCVTTSVTASAGTSISTNYDPRHSASYNARYNTVSTTQLAVQLTAKLNAQPTGKALRAHDPRGTATVTPAGSGRVQVAGWAAEPDFLGRRVVGDVTVDGTQQTMFVSKMSDRQQRKAGAGRLGAFDFDVPVAAGTHTVCVTLRNVGLGASVRLVCTNIYVSPAVGAAPVATDSANYAIVQEALRHVGQKYVWATQGPDTFDCSGLVYYAYGLAGVSVPRVAADQAAAARPITAAQAEPGDLVFYHDKKGHVYHVGIYLAPNETVAAIDPASGVDYQAIDDPSATYGTFTH